MQFYKKFLRFILVLSIGIFVLSGCGEDDKIPPEITLKGGNPLVINIGSKFKDPGATATDNKDGNITSKIIVKGKVDTAKVGVYKISYYVEDSAGNSYETFRTIIVKIIDKLAPSITLLGDNPLYIKKNSSYIEPGATAKDNIDGIVKVDINSSIDTNKIDEYIVTYTAKDKSGNIAKQERVVKVIPLEDAANVFRVEGNNSSELKVEGVEELSNGETGTSGGLTDVVAKKTVKFIDKNGEEHSKNIIVYRSFNLGQWKGKLNEETTLFARIFIDPLLIDIDDNDKIDICKTIKKEHIDLYNDALKYQKLSRKSSFFTPIYFDTINKLKEIVIENYRKKDIDNNNTKSNRYIFPSKRYVNVDNSFTNLSLLQVKSTEEKVEFANYANVYYGVRVYKYDNENKNYNYPIISPDVLTISPVSGGALGGLYDWISNKWSVTYKPSTSIKYNKLFGVDKDITGKHKALVEIYKWQGGQPTLLNGANGIALIIKTVTSGSNGEKLMKTIKNKLNDIQDKVEHSEDIIYGLDAILQILEGGADFLIFIDPDNKKLKDIKSMYDNTKKVIASFYKAFSVKPYSADVKDMNEIWQVKQFLGSFAPIVPSNPDNSNSKIREILQSEIDNIKDKKTEAKIVGTSLFINSILLPIIKSTKAGQKKLEKFSETYKKDITFKQLTYYMAIKAFDKNFNLKGISRGAIVSYSKIFISQKSLKSNFSIELYNVSKKYINKLYATVRSVEYIKKFFKTGFKVATQNPIDSLKKIGTWLVNAEVVNFKSMLGDTILNLIERANPASSVVKGAQAVNDWSSYLAGNFAVSNKQYFQVNFDNGKVDIELPPITYAGIDTQGKIKPIKGYSHYILGKGRFLVSVDGKSSKRAVHYPQFDMYFIENNGGTTFFDGDLEDLLETSAYKNKTIFTFDLNIKKSKDETEHDKSFEPFLPGRNSITNINITGKNITDAGIYSGNRNMSKLDIMKAWSKKIGEQIYVIDKTRGLFSESVTVNMKQLYSDKFILDDEMKQQSLSYYAYKVANSDLVKSNIDVTVNEHNNKLLYVNNKANFNICYEISYDIENGIFDMPIKRFIDCVKAGNTKSIDLSKYGNNINDVYLYFYDELAKKFFEKEGKNKPYIFNYNTFIQNDIAYKVDINNLSASDVFYLNKTNIRSRASVFYIGDKIELQFDSELPDDGQSDAPFVMPSKEVFDNIYFINHKTGEKIPTDNIYFASDCTSTETDSNGGVGVNCIYDKTKLEIDPIFDNNDYDIVVDTALTNNNGAKLDSTYKRFINTYKTDKFEVIYDKKEQKANSVRYYFKIYNKVNSNKLFVDYSTNNISGTVDITPKSGPHTIGMIMCSLNVIATSISGYKTNFYNYIEAYIEVFNDTKEDISDLIHIKFYNDLSDSYSMDLGYDLKKGINSDTCTIPRI